MQYWMNIIKDASQTNKKIETEEYLNKYQGNLKVQRKKYIACKCKAKYNQRCIANKNFWISRQDLFPWIGGCIYAIAVCIFYPTPRIRDSFCCSCSRTYFIFVNFFTQPQFEPWKFYTWKCVNARQKLPHDKTV